MEYYVKFAIDCNFCCFCNYRFISRLIGKTIFAFHRNFKNRHTLGFVLLFVRCSYFSNLSNFVSDFWIFVRTDCFFLVVRNKNAPKFKVKLLGKLSRKNQKILKTLFRLRYANFGLVFNHISVNPGECKGRNKVRKRQNLFNEFNNSSDFSNGAFVHG